MGDDQSFCFVADSFICTKHVLIYDVQRIVHLCLFIGNSRFKSMPSFVSDTIIDSLVFCMFVFQSYHSEINTSIHQTTAQVVLYRGIIR